MKLDLHVHTTASDGQYSPKDIIYMAKEKYSDFVKEYMRYLKGGGGTFV